MDNILNCKQCSLYKNQKPLLDKLEKSDVMWVGLSAKKVDSINANYPLENNTNSGKLIEEIENRNSKLKYYKTNLVKCLPLDEKGKIRYPSNEEMNQCIKNLFCEIEMVQPKKIFLLGNNVYNFISKYIKNNNIKIQSDIIKIEHPSYICVYRRKQKDEYINKVIKELNN